jgi:hypothetical protein
LGCLYSRNKQRLVTAIPSPASGNFAFAIVPHTLFISRIFFSSLSFSLWV